MTALVSCFARSYHADNSDHPVFNDSMASQLLKEEEKSLIAEIWAKAIYFFNPEKGESLKSEKEKLDWVMNTQCIPQLVSRSQYCEEQLKAAIQRGVRQCVILGAGLDTFAIREKGLPLNFMIFEVDHPLTQAFKVTRLQERGISIPDYVKFVPVDFTKDSLITELKKMDFDEEKLSFFSLLGVSMYLSKEDLFKLLTLVSEISPKGSSIIFDYLDDAALNDVLASKKMKQMRQITAQTGEHIKSGFDPLYLDLEIQDTGMLLYENLSPDDIEKKYFAKRKDDLHAFDHFHFAHLVNEK